MGEIKIWFRIDILAYQQLVFGEEHLAGVGLASHLRAAGLTIKGSTRDAFFLLLPSLEVNFLSIQP